MKTREDCDRESNTRRQPRIPPEDIARRAYELYLQRGGGQGYDLDDWLQAERELEVRLLADTIFDQARRYHR
jgi:hypothetical protein